MYILFGVIKGTQEFYGGGWYDDEDRALAIFESKDEAVKYIEDHRLSRPRYTLDLSRRSGTQRRIFRKGSLLEFYGDAYVSDDIPVFGG